MSESNEGDEESEDIEASGEIGEIDKAEVPRPEGPSEEGGPRIGRISEYR